MSGIPINCYISNNPKLYQIRLQHYIITTVCPLALRQHLVSQDLSAITVGIESRTICLLLMVLAKSDKDICMYLMKCPIYCMQTWNMQHSNCTEYTNSTATGPGI